MNSTTIIVIAVVVVIALAFLFLVRGRKQHVTFSDTPPLTPKAPPAPKVEPKPEPIMIAMPEPADPPAEAPVAEPEPVASTETPIVAPELVTPAEAPVVAPVAPTQEGPADTLTQLKGLGPKAAAILGGLGVTRFEQIASWSEAEVAAIDAQMGAFKGRIAKDRWVDQAKLLAKGDTAAFEAQFGALGG